MVVRALCGFLFCLCLLSGCGQGPPPDKLRVGGHFPNLQLTGLNGPDRRLDDYAGRLLIVNVWATWCPGCRRELPSLQHLQRLLGPGTVQILLLSVDEDPVLAREYLRQRALTLPAFIDPQQDIAHRLLGIRVYPDTFIVSADGVLLQRVVGAREWDAPRVVDILRRVADSGEADLLTTLFPGSP